MIFLNGYGYWVRWILLLFKRLHWRCWQFVLLQNLLAISWRTYCHSVWSVDTSIAGLVYTVGYNITLNTGNAQFVEQSSRNTNWFLYMELNYGEKKQKIWTTYPNSEKSIPNRPVGPRPLTATPPNNLGYMTLVTLICIFLIISGTYICSFVRDKSYSSEKAYYVTTFAGYPDQYYLIRPPRLSSLIWTS